MKPLIPKGAALTILAASLLLGSCGPSVRLTASWTDPQAHSIKFTRILVMAVGKDLSKRRLGEDALLHELAANGYNAAASIDELGPAFSGRTDSAAMQQTLLDKGFDGALTVRVLDIDERDRWVPGNLYYGPIGYYRGFYGYYYRVWGYYSAPGYRTTDVEVLLESNLYEVKTGRLIWSGQSKSFTREPTPAMAATYARNIVKDMRQKQALNR